MRLFSGLLARLATRGSEASKLRRARKKLRGMTASEFAWVQHEVQYALKFHDAAKLAARAAYSCAYDASDIDHKPLYAAEGKHRERVGEIRDSPLYDAVRAEMRFRNIAAPPRWIGWIGLEDSEIESINDALASIQKGRYPILGTVVGSSEFEARQRAPATIAGYGITGALTGEGDLTDLFLTAKLGSVPRVVMQRPGYTGGVDLTDPFEKWRAEREGTKPAENSNP